MASNWINERDYIIALKERLDYYNQLFLDFIETHRDDERAINELLTEIEDGYYNDRLTLSKQYGMEIKYLHHSNG